MIVVVREEGRLTTIAALGDVVGHAGGGGTGETGHDPTQARSARWVNCLRCPRILPSRHMEVAETPLPISLSFTPPVARPRP